MEAGDARLNHDVNHLLTCSLPFSHKLSNLRSHCGNNIGSLEAWLLLRSLRTLHLRVPRQSQTATAIAQWLNLASGGKSHDGIPAGLIDVVHHSSLQEADADGFTPEKQMEGGYNATFGIIVGHNRVRSTTAPSSICPLLDDQSRLCEDIDAFLAILCGM